MTDGPERKALSYTLPDASAVSTVLPTIPLGLRLAHEIPKPKDWQSLQRGCVFVFRGELNDPSANEYGRNGQGQHGIDILGRRNSNPDHYVGIQCRHISKPLKYAKILLDCREALKIKVDLKEIIFATTADDDTQATDAAAAVEKLLREEGEELTVSIFGWPSLQTLIAVHDLAYAYFFPAAISTSAPQPVRQTRDDDLASEIAVQVSERLLQMGFVASKEADRRDLSAEDPILHARIDTFRDLLKEDQPRLAEKGLLALLEKEALENKPWARFRIETNLASAAIDLGREGEAAVRFEAAYAVRPDDANAIANLALARTIQGRYPEAMDLAGLALSATPRADHAVGYLLQAAGRSDDFNGDPIALIPKDLLGSASADLGIAIFNNRRNVPGWAEQNRQIASRHRDVPELRHIGAIATLASIIDSGAVVPGARSPVSGEELDEAADDMKMFAEHLLDIGFTERHDLVAALNNAGVLLRLADRQADCERLLLRSGEIAQSDPQLKRLLALSQLSQGRAAEALTALEGEREPESELMAADLISASDPASALERVLAIEPSALDERLKLMRWRLLGDLALLVADEQLVQLAVAGLRGLEHGEAEAELLLVRNERKQGLDDVDFQDRLRSIAGILTDKSDILTRYQVAEFLRRNDLPEEAAALLDKFVDLQRPGPLTTLYLQSLASARRDQDFRDALENAGAAVRNSREVLWLSATHAWNVGDLPLARQSIEGVLHLDHLDANARLLKIEILLRQNDSAELVAELDRSIESLPFNDLNDRFRVARLLGHFGYLERAAGFAYRLFLENRDQSQAWMTLSSLVIEEGRGEEERLWMVEAVGPNVAIDLTYEDGEARFLIVEPDVELRRLDDESWEPEHPLVQSLMGISVGADFVDPSGRNGKIAALRHKYVARLHYVLEHYESRFPEIFGFRRVEIDTSRPGGLDALIAELKQRQDWVKQEQETYVDGHWPLATLAHRIGVDTIDMASGLARQGIQLKVANGNEVERKAAVQAIRENASKGCVLDLLTFWTSWRLQALDTIESTCGRIHLPQSVLDRLNSRRETIRFSVKDGLKSAQYHDGKIAATEIAPEEVQQWLEDTEKAIAWVKDHAIVSPVIATDQTPDILVDFLHNGRSDMFDCVALAIQNGLLLVIDDQGVRESGSILGWKSSAWLHQVFSVALARKVIDFDEFVRLSAHLVAGGQTYLGVSGFALVRALRIDAAEGKVPGYLFATLVRVIGGKKADPESHLGAALECARELWSDGSSRSFRQPATGMLLEQLIFERHDYAALLRGFSTNVAGYPFLKDYLARWVRGHFLPAGTLATPA